MHAVADLRPHPAFDDRLQIPLAADCCMGPGLGSGPQMEAQPRTFRLAIGLFSDARALADGLTELSAQGLASRSLCLIGLSDTMGPALWREDLDGALFRFRSLFVQVQEMHGPFDAITSVASSGSLLEDLRASSTTTADGKLGCMDWLSDSQLNRLKSHVGQGGLVLIVSSQTPSEQDAACRSLLKHSRHGVQTHDFTLRTPAA